MKIRETDQQKLNELLKPVDTPQHRALYKANGKSHKDYAWALFWRVEAGLSKELYKYLNDANIETALLKLVKKP